MNQHYFQFNNNNSGIMSELFFTKHGERTFPQHHNKT